MGIANILNELEQLHLNLNVKEGKILSVETNITESVFYEVGNVIELEIRQLYLDGKEKTIFRIKSELEKIKNTYESIDFDLQFQQIDNLKEGEKFTINKVILEKYANLRLFYIDRLIEYIDNLDLVFFNHDVSQPFEIDRQSAKDKFRLLVLLGVLDNLMKEQPFVSSPNLLAKYLAKITGESQTTIYPYLNSYLSNRYDKNHPFNPNKHGENPAQNLIDQLESIGFQPKSTDLGNT